MSGSNSLREIVAAIIAALVPVDYLQMYPARVVSQAPDGGPLDLIPDNPRIPPMTGVPIRGLPGVKVWVNNRARVLLAFEGGSPHAPVAVVAESSGLDKLRIDAAVQVDLYAPMVTISDAAAFPVARQGDIVQVMSTAPGTPAFGTIMTGQPKAKA